MKYKNSGVFPVVVSGLIVGVNATVILPETSDSPGIPDGSTVVLNPGDIVDTEYQVDHAGIVPSPDVPDVPVESKPTKAGKAATTEE